MKGELYHAQNPRHTYVRWALFYVLLTALLVAAFYYFTGRIRTYSIPSGALTLSVPYKKYLVGESIQFTLKNDYNSTIYIENECPEEPLNVYRKQGDDWVRLHDKANTALCTAATRQIALAAHTSQTGTFDAWPNLFKEPGIYRIVAYVEYFDAAPYQDIEVVAKPEKKATTPAPVTTATTTQQTAATASSPTTPTSTTTTTPSTPAVTYTEKTISVPSGGSISVKYTSTSFTITAVKPLSGCTYEGKGAGYTGTFSETTFKCGGGETQIQLSLVNGVLRQKIED